MRPLDPRLIRRARSARRFVIGAVLLGTASAALVVAFSYLIARIITRVFQGDMTVSEISPLLGWLAIVVLLRAGTSYFMEVVATRGSAGVKQELREQLLAQLSTLGPVWLTGQRRSDLVLLMGRGLDGLDNYFARFLPQLILSCVVPVVVIGVMCTQDWLSALIVIVTLPLIPVFMVLIGKRTEHAQQRQWQDLIRLGGHFLDVVRGLPTLKIFGRSRAQVDRVQEIGEDYRRTTMKVLRISFLSSLALELLATLSVAIIAVEIGIRLVDGTLVLFVGLFVLLLAPEAYLPLRLVGQHFHASQEGVTAVEAAFRVLDEPAVIPAGNQRVAVHGVTISLDNVEVTYPGVDEPALRTSLRIQPHEVVALVGPSGCGKTTLLLLLARLVGPSAGEVAVTEPSHTSVTWDTIDTADWRSQVAYLPQHPVFVAGSVADNVRVVAPAASDAEIVDALRSCGASFVLDHPDGIHWLLGEAGAGMSAGQRQRVALARILVRGPALVLLDEPTAALDGASERDVVEAIQRVAVGRTMVVVAHRQPLIDMADRVVAGKRPESFDRRGADVSTLRRLWGFGSGVRVKLIAALVLGACASGAAVALTATSAFLISKASEQPPILTLSVAIVGVRFFGVSRGVARYSERLVGHDATFGVMSRLRAAVYGRVERLAPGGLPIYRSGDLLSRFVRDVDDTQELFLRVLPPYVIAVCVGSATCGFLFWVLPAAGVICAVGLGVTALVVPRLASRSTKQAEHAIATDRAAISSQTLEWLSALPELAMAGTAELHAGRINDTSEHVRRSESRLVHVRGLAGVVVMVMLGATVLGCLVVGGRAVVSGRLDGVMLAVVVLTPLAAFDLTTPLPEAFQRWHMVRSASARIFDVMDQPDVLSEPATPLDAPAAPITVELRKVSARWPSSRQLNVREVNINLAPGEVLAVVGPSGAGKSTLAAVLVGFLRSEAGRYSLNGVRVDELTTDELRTRVGLLTQDSYVFDSTIRENLLIGDREADDPQLTDALRQARLWDWVEQQPNGLDAFVGEHGARMSGGQRQRLCLARLLLADFPVVVLDEPAEHLDRDSARRLMADLLSATRGKSRVVITHQLSDTTGVDHVIVLDDGRIRESGSPEQLLARNGWYATNLAAETQQGI